MPDDPLVWRHSQHPDDFVTLVLPILVHCVVALWTWHQLRQWDWARLWATLRGGLRAPSPLVKRATPEETTQ